MKMDHLILCPAGVLRNCWPAWDHQSVRCGRVERRMEHNTTQLTWVLQEGRLISELKTQAGVESLTCRLEDCSVAPHWLSPIGDAVVEGFDSCFRQGIGFSGPSGCLAFADLGDEWHQPSYLSLGLFCAEGEPCTTIYSTDHSAYLFRADIRQQAWRHNFATVK